MRVVAVLLASLGLIPLVNLVGSGQAIPWWRTAVYQWLVWTAILAAVAWVVAATLPRFTSELIARGERLLLRPTTKQFVAIVGGATCVLAVFFGWRLFALQPGAGDELAQQWQAHLLGMGRLFAHTEPHPEFFSTELTVETDGKWFAQFPIGYPALLAVGQALRLPWLINPLLAGLTSIAVYRFASRITDEPLARGTAIIFALCPFALFMAGSAMNHTSALACLWVAIAALPAWLDADTPARTNGQAVIIGAGIGVAATIRPYDAAIFALVIGVFQLHAAWKRPTLFRSLLVQGCVGIIPILALLAVNQATTGHPLSFAYDVLNGPEHRPGFHLSPLGFEHTPKRGLLIISTYLLRLDASLLAWPVPSVLLVVLTMALQRKTTRWDFLMLALLVALLAGYAAYWSESYFLGPRFLFPVIPILVIYIARLPRALAERVRGPVARSAIALAIPLWLIVTWAAPAKPSQYYGVWRLSSTYRTHGPVAAAILDSVKSSGISNAVVFIPEGWHGRLAARLRALGIRPLLAELIVAQNDACTLQQGLDAVDHATTPPAERINDFLALVRKDPPAIPIEGQTNAEQLAFVPGRELAASCKGEVEHATSIGVTLSQLLPHEELDADGRLGGRVVYARDFGARNELLRDRFGDRRWYVPRIVSTDGRVTVTLEPHTR